MSQKTYPFIFRSSLGILAILGLVVWSGCGSISLQARQNPKYQNAMRADQRLRQTNSVQNNTPDQRSSSSYASHQNSSSYASRQSSSQAAAPSSTANFESNHVFELYYEQLTDDEKYVYDLVYEALMAYQTTVEYPFVLEETNRAVWSVFYDHPEIFWATHVYNVVETNYNNGKYSSKLTLEYYRFNKSIDAIKKDIDNEMAKWFPDIDQYQTEYERERYIHDQIVKNTTYKLNPDYRHSIYSVFVNKIAICEGFARAFQYAMLKYGLNATYIGGERNGSGHSWAQVYIQGNCYNVDVTDGYLKPDEDRGNTGNLPVYTRFNLTDKELQPMGYVRDSDIKSDIVALPVCGNREFSFENTFGAQALQSIYSEYFNIPSQHVVNQRSQHDNNMKRAGYEAKGSSYRVYEIVTDQKLMNELYDLDTAKNKSGYVNELWDSKFKQYKHHGSSSSYVEITKDSYLMYFDERYH